MKRRSRSRRAARQDPRPYRIRCRTPSVSRAMALELAPYCIRVNAMPPWAGPEFARHVHFRHRIPIGYGAARCSAPSDRPTATAAGGHPPDAFRTRGASAQKSGVRRPPCRPVSQSSPDGSGGPLHAGPPEVAVTVMQPAPVVLTQELPGRTSPCLRRRSEASGKRHHQETLLC